MVEVTRIKRKKSLSLTLRSLQVGEVVTIRPRDYRETIVRSTASRMKKEGYEFSVSISDQGSSVKRLM